MRVSAHQEVSAHLAGTTSRFLLALGCLSEVPITVTGEAPLLARPIGDLAEALRTLGFSVEPRSSSSLPLTVSLGVDSESIGSDVTIRGDVSSQFISALMMIGPTLHRGLRIHVDGELVSRSYVEMTSQVMATFGASVEVSAHDIVVAATGYQPAIIDVEPDFSSAAFPVCAAVLSGKKVRIPGLSQSRLQGDARILNILEEMGARIVVDNDDIVVTRDASTPLEAITTDMADCSDLVPVVATLCTFADGVSELSGIGFIRKKESDRLGDLSNELAKTGAHVEVLEDGLRIHPVAVRHCAVLDTHHDHRLAMSFALLALRIQGIEIRDPSVVSKSWPQYWTAMTPLLRARTPRHATVAFDLDKTLTIRDCVVPFLSRCAGRTTFAFSLVRHFPKISGFLFRRDRDGLKAFASQLVFAGRSVSEIQEIGEEFATYVANTWMRRDTCAVLKWHQEQGDDVVLVTASFAPYVFPLAQVMGIAHVLSTDISADAGTYTGVLVNGNCRGPEKARRLAEWLGDRELDYAYGDSSGDDAMLAMANHAVRVGRGDVRIPVTS
jgi:3-phosphoshikimate 1-carboxyvinyltransferase